MVSLHLAGQGMSVLVGVNHQVVYLNFIWKKNYNNDYLKCIENYPKII